MSIAFFILSFPDVYNPEKGLLHSGFNGILAEQM